MTDLNISAPFFDYIQENWSLLAAAAYSGFLKKGRGMLWIDWLNQLPINYRVNDIGVIYITNHSKITRAIFPEGMSSEARRLIRQYDPQISAILYWSEGEMNYGRTIAFIDETPLQAYGFFKGRLEEFELLVTLETGDEDRV